MGSQRTGVQFHFCLFVFMNQAVASALPQSPALYHAGKGSIISVREKEALSMQLLVVC